MSKKLVYFHTRIIPNSDFDFADVERIVNDIISASERTIYLKKITKEGRGKYAISIDCTEVAKDPFVHLLEENGLTPVL